MFRIAVLACALGWSVGASAQAPDEAAAQATLKAGGCLRCHSVGADKEGPSFRKTAAKYKGQANAAAKLEGELKSGALKVDGKEVKHAAFKTKDDAAIRNAVGYILSR